MVWVLYGAQTNIKGGSKYRGQVRTFFNKEPF
jgi:hypothetical protein